MIYKIFFELFDRRMKYEIEADSPDLAVRKLKDKIVIYKVVPTDPEPDDPGVEYLKNLFGMK